MSCVFSNFKLCISFSIPLVVHKRQLGEVGNQTTSSRHNISGIFLQKNNLNRTVFNRASADDGGFFSLIEFSQSFLSMKYIKKFF